MGTRVENRGNGRGGHGIEAKAPKTRTFDASGEENGEENTRGEEENRNGTAEPRGSYHVEMKATPPDGELGLMRAGSCEHV